jgi:hypothetical protein
LAHAKSLVLGDESVPPPARKANMPFAPWPDEERERSATRADKSFWASVAAADRRLADLRRAIDHAAAEAAVREDGVESPPSPAFNLGESRCKTANRVITDALGAEKT